MKLILYRVLPISIVSGLLLFNFQNCANPNALTSDGQTVASDTTGSGGGTSATNPNDLFRPVARTPDSGGGTSRINIPVCFRILEANKIDVANSENEKDPLLNVSISLYGNSVDKYGRPTEYVVSFFSGKLILKNSSGTFEYDFSSENSKYEHVGYFQVPYSVYINQENIKVTGFFSGRWFTNMPLNLCSNKK